MCFFSVIQFCATFVNEYPIDLLVHSAASVFCKAIAGLPAEMLPTFTYVLNLSVNGRSNSTLGNSELFKKKSWVGYSGEPCHML